jgi:hypothetical protein
MTLICRCGSHALRITSQTYPTDDDGRAVGTATECYECEECGATGSYIFGDGSDHTTGCVTTSSTEARI